MLFTRKEPFKRLSSDAPAKLRGCAEYLRRTMAPMVSEMLVTELAPTEDDFRANHALADALCERAIALEEGLCEYNSSQGHVTARTRQRILDAIAATRESLMRIADSANKYKVHKDQPDFKLVARRIMDEVKIQLGGSLDSISAAETQLFDTMKPERFRR